MPEVFLIILPDHLMVESKVHFMGCNFAQTLLVRKVHFVNCFLKRSKVLQNALVNKNVPICQVQNPLFHVRTEQTVHNLKSGICFSCSCCHDKQQPLLPSGNGFNSPVNRIPLIIARRVRALRRIVRLRDDFLFQIRNALAAVQLSVISRHKHLLSWKFLQCNLLLFSGQEVMLIESISV